jgi:hypothetical protein
MSPRLLHAVGSKLKGHERFLLLLVKKPIYEQCELIWFDFVSILLEHCNREANGVPYELARIALQKKLTCNWVDEPPRFLLRTLVNDVTILQN